MPSRLAIRAPVIVVAYMAAALAAGLIVSAYDVLVTGPIFALESLGKAAALGFVYGSIAVVMVALPAALCIVLAEFFGWRTLWLHLLLGGLLGAGMARLIDHGTGFGLRTTIALAVAGAVAGLVYWAIAGRKAGLRAPRSS
ncbi:MAG: translation initiation factor IF-3 [Rhizobiales bacterium]|nr:translation initiation factor IF-3 [Hyphomicrobiales bacterium]MBI3673109.1 translation initiation factor IF-3 [Hyphomicrobiales bacterium]